MGLQANSFELVLDSTDYVGDRNLTMTPTVRNQQHKGDPVDPDDPHYAEQVAAMPDRVPVPPYWNKVFATWPWLCGGCAVAVLWLCCGRAVTVR